MVTEANFRHLEGIDPLYHLLTEDEPYKSVIQQYEEALRHLVGKRLSDHLADLYEPEALVTNPSRRIYGRYDSRGENHLRFPRCS